MKPVRRSSVLCRGVVFGASALWLMSALGRVLAQAPVPSPTVTGPITRGSRTGGPYNASLFDLSKNRYVEEEYFLSGMASDYTAPPNSPPAAYTTRIVVRRPIDPARFNGTVYMEWLNVSAAVEIEAQYAYLIPELLRSGYAAVIVSAQSLGVTSTQNWDPVRYDALSHPGDDYSFDIETQPFDQATLDALYPSQEAYEAMLREATDQSVAAGFVLPADARYWYCDAFQLGEPLIFLPTRDCDGDGVAYSVDNCDALPNPGLEDTGGIGSGVGDGIGNACQCGDVTGDGVVSGQDGAFITRFGLGYVDPVFVEPGNCDVTGNGICNGQDGYFTTRAGLSFVDPLFIAPQGQNCPNAAGGL